MPTCITSQVAAAGLLSVPSGFFPRGPQVRRGSRTCPQHARSDLCSSCRQRAQRRRTPTQVVEHLFYTISR